MNDIRVEDSWQLDEIDKVATGHRIKLLAKNVSLSQTELAGFLDRTKKTVSNYYCGVSLPDKSDLIKLSSILGKSIDEILVFRGDVEGYRRVDYFLIEYDESINDGINRSKTESELFNPYSKGRANIRNFEEAGYCLEEYFSPGIVQDLRNRMMDELFSGGGVNSPYMHHIFEVYIWRRLSEEQKAESKSQFALWRGDE